MKLGIVKRLAMTNIPTKTNILTRACLKLGVHTFRLFGFSLYPGIIKGIGQTNKNIVILF